MRHRFAGKQLSRTTSHRKALRRNMAASLIQHGAIRTTAVKAKELQRFVERIITMAKKGTLHARRLVVAKLSDRAMADDEGVFADQTVVQKLFSEVAPTYADRPGGYTRIIRLDERRIGDAGSQVILQLVGQGAGESGGKAGKASRRARRAKKRHEAVTTTEQPTENQDQGPDGQEPAGPDGEEQAAKSKEGSKQSDRQAKERSDTEEK